MSDVKILSEVNNASSLPESTVLERSESNGLTSTDANPPSTSIGADDEKFQKTRKHATPKEDCLRTEINSLEIDEQLLERKKSTGIISQEQRDDLNKIRRKKKTLQAELSKLLSNRQSQHKLRNDRLKKLVSNPALRKALKCRKKVGRPSLNEDNPELLKTIADIALHGSAADERRRSDVIRSIKTLDELTEEISNRLGITVKIFIFITFAT